MSQEESGRQPGIPGESLTLYSHMDPEKHLIGESLPVPGTVSSDLIVGTGTLGVSPIAAREDHAHPPNASLVNWGIYQEFTTGISGTGWAVGNGFLNGRYTQINRFCHFRMQFISGTTSTYGTGQLVITLPFGMAVAYRQFFRGWIVSGTIHEVIASSINTSTAAVYCQTLTAGIGVSSVVQNTPVTWVAGATLSIDGCYEIV